MSLFNHLFLVLKKPWFILMYVLFLVLFYVFVDISVAINFHDMNTRNTMPWLNWITALGENKPYILLFFLLGCYAQFIKKNPLWGARAWFLFLCVLLPNLLGIVLKICLGRARTDLFFSQEIYGFFWFKLDELYWSCPSGHALTITGLAFGLSILFPLASYLWLLLALAVVATRVILYHHYLSDVMVGFYLGILIPGLLLQWVKRYPFFNRVVSNSKKVA